MQARRPMRVILRFRVPEALARDLEAEAQRLRVKTTDLARVALAQGLAAQRGQTAARSSQSQMEV